MEFQRHPREYFQNSNPIPFPPPNNNNMMLMNNNTNNNNNNNNNNFNTNLTLIVKHLPEAIPFDTLMRLFSHYGASAVRPCSAGRLKNCAFVDFKDEALASRAESQLNRLRFLGKVLVVERAKPIPAANQSKQPNRTDSIPAPVPVHSVKNEDKAGGKDAMHVDQSSSVAEPIAPKLGIDYPFPPHLEYAYPPPDGNILTNIVNALIAVPRFYTQVLHLMNKMNLPAPFGPALPTPPLPSSTPPIPVPSAPQPDENDLSTDESELESSDEEEPEGGNMTSGGKYIPKSKKRKLKQQKLDPSLENRTSTQTVTVKPASLLPKEIPTLKKKQPFLQIKITPKGLNSEGIKNNQEDASSSIEKSKIKSEMKCATIEELQAGKMHPSEILSLPMFKNYAPGNPALVLYIKNLAKDVVVDDLYYVFGSLFKGASEAKAVLGVKLMQEGRMRGQAFVTFPSVDLADHALKMAHGFILKGKPMIIQFGRNPSSSKAD